MDIITWTLGTAAYLSVLFRTVKQGIVEGSSAVSLLPQCAVFVCTFNFSCALSHPSHCAPCGLTIAAPHAACTLSLSALKLTATGLLCRSCSGGVTRKTP